MNMHWITWISIISTSSTAKVAHRYATFLCSWDDSLVGQLTTQLEGDGLVGLEHKVGIFRDQDILYKYIDK